LAQRCGDHCRKVFADLQRLAGEALPDLDQVCVEALARLLRNTEAGILFNECIAKDGPVVFARLPAWGGGHRVEEG
jgi:hypothetical protein